MVQRIFLALILIVLSTLIYAQLDSLEVVTEDSLRIQIPLANRQVIEYWVTDQMQARRLFQSFLRDSSPVLNSVDIYRAAYHAVGMDNMALGIQRYGFSVVPGIWSQAFYLQQYDSVYRQTVSGSTVGFTEPKYDDPVLITDLHAGLGDYEFNFARVGLKKNQIFGFPGLYYSLDFLGQTGLWTGINHNQSSMRHYLSIALGRFVIEGEYMGWAVDASSQDLKPMWWQSANYVIEHKYKQFYAALRNPWLDLSLISVSDQAKATLQNINLRNSSLQVKASKALQIGAHQLYVDYEHASSELEYTPIPTAENRVYDDLVSARYLYVGDRLNADLEARYYNLKDLYLEGDSSWNWLGMKLGVHGMKSGLANASQSVIDLYNPTATIYPVSQILNAQYSGYVSANLLQDIELSLNAGQKVLDSSGSTWSDQTTLPFADLKLGLQKDYGKYRLSASQVLNWQAEADAARPGIYYTELPGFRYQSYLQLKRDMDNDNALFAGLSYVGHSSYFSSTQTAQEFAAAGIMDMWAGVQISKLFELTLSFKNVLDSDIYGIYPIPRSVHASLRWFYLN